MLAPEHDTTIGLTVAGALTPAGLGGCAIELMERGLIDFIISTGQTSIDQSAIAARISSKDRWSWSRPATTAVAAAAETIGTVIVRR